MIEDVRVMLAELAVLAEQVERDERRILEAAQHRLSQLSDRPQAEAERATLERVIARAEAVLDVQSKG